MTFYSLLGVSVDVSRSVYKLLNLDILSTPFWEFLISIKDSFNAFVMLILLSTPFWEFLLFQTSTGLG